MNFLPSLSPALALATLIAVLAPLSAAQAQSVCSSERQPRPLRLVERFINANCESCWSDPATLKAGKGDAVLDWVVPGDKGDDAPLSAVATRDGLNRLEALGKSLPEAGLAAGTPVHGLPRATLRVARGLALNGYLGASIELKPLSAAGKQRWKAWLALVETIPAGTEGSPVERNLVRNLLQLDWDAQAARAAGAKRFYEARSMSIASGANPERLKVIGWVEDDKGRLLAAAQSQCAP